LATKRWPSTKIPTSPARPERRSGRTDPTYAPRPICIGRRPPCLRRVARSRRLAATGPAWPVPVVLCGANRSNLTTRLLDGPQRGCESRRAPYAVVLARWQPQSRASAVSQFWVASWVRATRLRPAPSPDRRRTTARWPGRRAGQDRWWFDRVRCAFRCGDTNPLDWRSDARLRAILYRAAQSEQGIARRT
jgi:hypothetical protein